MTALGVSDLELQGNWTRVESIAAGPAADVDGAASLTTPKVWLSSSPASTVDPSPAALSFQDGCGRSFFSTFHTEPQSGTLLMPQELALMHVLLETADCVDPLP